MLRPKAFGSRAPSTPGEASRLTALLWITAGFLAYWSFPWVALEYGLFDATVEEYLAALGWRHSSMTLIVPIAPVSYTHLRAHET